MPERLLQQAPGVVPDPSEEIENVNSMAQDGTEADMTAPAGEPPKAPTGSGPVLVPWTPPAWSRDVERAGDVALASFTVGVCECVSPLASPKVTSAIVSVEQTVELVDVHETTYLAGAGDIRVNVAMPAGGSDIGLSVSQARALAEALHRAADYALQAASADAEGR